MKTPNFSLRHENLYIKTLWLALGLSALFTSFPQIDLYVSSFFYEAGNGFFLARSQTLEYIRNFYMLLTVLLSILAVTMIVCNLLSKARAQIPVSFWLFIAGSLCLGPGLLVNLILKSNWGRARPADVIEFGGLAEFTPAFQFVEQCSSNCSFVSGEASAITCVFIMIAILFWNRYTKQRGLLLASLTGLVLFGISLRVATGRHFASDVLLGAIFSCLIILVLYRFFKIEKISNINLVSALQSDCRLFFRRQDESR